MDYLCVHSALLRRLLTVSPPVTGICHATLEQYAGRLPLLSALFSSATLLSPPLPYIMPGSVAGRVIVFLPLPDPASILHLIHYMYFGSMFFLDQALDTEELKWEGLARNVDYLEMGADVDLVLSLYWRRLQGHLQPGRIIQPGNVHESSNPPDEVSGQAQVDVEEVGEGREGSSDEAIDADSMSLASYLPERLLSAPCVVQSSSGSGPDTFDAMEGLYARRRSVSE